MRSTYLFLFAVLYISTELYNGAFGASLKNQLVMSGSERKTVAGSGNGLPKSQANGKPEPDDSTAECACDSKSTSDDDYDDYLFELLIEYCDVDGSVSAQSDSAEGGNTEAANAIITKQKPVPEADSREGNGTSSDSDEDVCEILLDMLFGVCEEDYHSESGESADAKLAGKQLAKPMPKARRTLKSMKNTAGAHKFLTAVKAVRKIASMKKN
ncbi:hypothetical protein Ddc_14479 [Ditylenchus destructor]|nr:hypothetical protein Ddc_14479 [Ditylenchus destructor]